ncbi:MAG: hypothetical protein D4R67_12915, partial [Bacteroidetes bacterium]
MRGFFIRGESIIVVHAEKNPCSESQDAGAFAGRVYRAVTTERVDGEYSHAGQDENKDYAVFYFLFF